MNNTQIADRDVRARELHQKILISAQLVAQNLWEMCSSLKEMRDDKLYKSFGYANFEDYCEKEVGLKRRQAYKYIAIAENSPMDFVHSSAQIGVTKLALLASISDGEREQVMEETNVESVTVRELKEQIRTLRADKERLETDLSDADKSRDNLKKALAETKKSHAHQVSQIQDDYNHLAAELNDLRNNPMPEDKYRIAAKKHDKDMMEFREQMDRNLHDEMQKRWDLQAQFDDFRKKQQDIIADMERQLQEAKDAASATVIEVNPAGSMFNAYYEIVQNALYSAIHYAIGASDPEPLYSTLEDLLNTFIDLIHDQRKDDE